MIDILQELSRNSDVQKVANSKNGLIKRDSLFFHVIQQTDNRTHLFNAEVARYRDRLFKTECQKNNVQLIASVIMPSHTHDIVASTDLTSIFEVYKSTNRGTAHFIRKCRTAASKSNIESIFTARPGYVAIQDRVQFMVVLKYLFDNPAYLKEQNEFVPYSCFDSWEKKYYKPFNVGLIEKILELSIDDLVNKLRTLSSDEIKKLAISLYGKDKREYSLSLFSK